ncbi:MAG: efflux RND transporter periplasmic adaptor subunit, partial [Proteobacteria bacterium]|nr:efflux RND transporter periplasmic adaptor subunit [Pseudomonadota bacterium]
NAVQEKSWIVETVPARVTDFQPDLTLFGEVVAGRQVELRPLVAGQIVAVGDNFRDGGIVRREDLLVEIDPFEYQAAVAETSAQLDEARARLREIRAEYEGVKAQLPHDRTQRDIRRRDVTRREKLRGSGASSDKSLDDARLALSQAEQAVADRERAIATWQAKVAQQEATVARMAVALQRAKRDLEETHLLAPFDGFVLDVEAEIGKRLGTGDRVATVIDSARLEVLFHIGNAQFAALNADGGYRGRKAKIYWRGGDPDNPLAARLEREGSQIQAVSGGISLYASLQDVGPDSTLRPGAFVRVEMPGPEYKDVMRLPESALYGGDTVYVVVDDRLVARKTEVVARLGSDVVLRGGLADGEAVLVTRFPEVGAGVLVSQR